MLESLKHAEANEDEYKRRAIEARKTAETEVRAQIGLACDVSLHVGKLYGSLGQVTCEQPRYSSIDKLPAPTVADVEALLAFFVPMEMNYRKGACTSFRPILYHDKDHRETDTVKLVAPILIRLKPGEFAELSIEWYGEHDKELWRVKVELPYSLVYQSKLGRLDLRYTSTAFGRERQVERCEFSPIEPFTRVRWANGGRQYANEFTVYAPPGTDVWAIVKKALSELK